MAVVDFSALSAYVDQISSKLIKKALLTDRTIQTGITVQTGIKGTEAINILTGSIIGQNTDCGLSPTGSVAITQRNITVCPITVYEDVCASKFDAYWTQILNPAGSYYEKNPVEQIYVDQKVNAITKLSGSLLWRGDTSGRQYSGATSATTGNITLCNGVLNILQYQSGSASVLTSTYSGTAMTTANALTIIQSLISTALVSAPDILVEEGKNIYMSYAKFDLVRQALFAGNYYHYAADANQGGEWMIKNFLGTGFDLISTEGLNTTNRIVLTYAKNIILGVDLENDQEQFEVFYDRYRDLVLFRAKWKQGAQVAFPTQVVIYYDSYGS